MNVTPTTNLRCVVERITYQNPENGYSVLKVRVKGYSDLVTLVGNLLEVPVGSVLLCRGEWKVDKRYGSQFVAATWEETMPATVYGIEKYLGSGLVKGIGPRFARAIVQRFGTETINIIETDIERLYEVPNIGRKRVAKIRESWEKQKDIKNVMLFLQGYGVSTAYAAKIYREYGKESIEKVRENPYRLADDIWGIGFKTADGIAGKMGYGKEDPRRCRSGILYTLGQLSDEGHVYAEEEQLVKTAGELLEAGEAPIREVLEQMIRSEDLIFDKEAIYLPPFYHAECGTASAGSGSARRPFALRHSVRPGASHRRDRHRIRRSAGRGYPAGRYVQGHGADGRPRNGQDDNDARDYCGLTEGRAAHPAGGSDRTCRQAYERGHGHGSQDHSPSAGIQPAGRLQAQ